MRDAREGRHTTGRLSFLGLNFSVEPEADTGESGETYDAEIQATAQRDE